MNIYKIDKANASAVAKLMSDIRPDWWDFEGASMQLQEVSCLVKLIAGILVEKMKPKGWILCVEYKGYSYLSIECLGYDQV